MQTAWNILICHVRSQRANFLLDKVKVAELVCFPDIRGSCCRLQGRWFLTKHWWNRKDRNLQRGDTDEGRNQRWVWEGKQIPYCRLVRPRNQSDSKTGKPGDSGAPSNSTNRQRQTQGLKQTSERDTGESSQGWWGGRNRKWDTWRGKLPLRTRPKPPTTRQTRWNTNVYAPSGVLHVVFVRMKNKIQNENKKWIQLSLWCSF